MKLGHEVHNLLATKAGILCFRTSTFTPEMLAEFAGEDVGAISEATEDDFRAIARVATISSTRFSITYNPKARLFTVVSAF